MEVIGCEDASESRRFSVHEDSSYYAVDLQLIQFVLEEVGLVSGESADGSYCSPRHSALSWYIKCVTPR